MTNSGGFSEIDSLACSEEKVTSFCHWFNSRFSTDADCIDELYRHLLDAGIAHRCCTNPMWWKEPGQRIVQCHTCLSKTSITAGTLFHKIKRVRAWLALILMKQDGIIVNPFQFHKFFNVAYATAADMFKKLRLMFEQTMQLDSPSVPSSAFFSLIFRRSRKTLAEQHPTSELDDSCEFETAEATISLRSFVNDPNVMELSPTEQKVFDCLSSADKVHFDKLCNMTSLETGSLSAALVMLELYGLVHPIPGDHYVRSKPHLLRKEIENADVLPRINIAAKFIRSLFQGISRRYLQLYLAEFWFHANRKNLLPNFLFASCIKGPPLDHKAMLAYVSPQIVRLP